MFKFNVFDNIYCENSNCIVFGKFIDADNPLLTYYYLYDERNNENIMRSSNLIDKFYELSKN